MQTLQSTTIFTPAAGEAVTVSAVISGTVGNLPAVDAGNTAMTVTVPGSADVMVSFGLATPKLFPGDGVPYNPQPYEAHLYPGTYLLPAPLAAIAAASTTVSVAVHSGTATPGVTFQRGSISTLQAFA